MPFYWFELADADWKRIYSPCSLCATLDACPCTFDRYCTYASKRWPRAAVPAEGHGVGVKGGVLL
ncbi:hypothetical protein HaLaN_15781, partial [Haematococcus lacustris]